MLSNYSSSSYLKRQSLCELRSRSVLLIFESDAARGFVARAQLAS